MYGEEATSSDQGKQTRTLLDFNFVIRKKFDEEQDKDDWSSDRGKTCFVLCGAYPYSLAAPATLVFFDNPGIICYLGSHYTKRTGQSESELADLKQTTTFHQRL